LLPSRITSVAINIRNTTIVLVLWIARCVCTRNSGCVASGFEAFRTIVVLTCRHVPPQLFHTTTFVPFRCVFLLVRKPLEQANLRLASASVPSSPAAACVFHIFLAFLLASLAFFSTTPLLFRVSPSCLPIVVIEVAVKRLWRRRWLTSFVFMFATPLLLLVRPIGFPAIVIMATIECWRFRFASLAMMVATPYFLADVPSCFLVCVTRIAIVLLFLGGCSFFKQVPAASVVVIATPSQLFV